MKYEVTSDGDIEEFINMGREMARKPYIDNSLILQTK